MSGCDCGSDCERCQRTLPPTEFMQEVMAKHGLKYVIVEGELLLVSNNFMPGCTHPGMPKGTNCLLCGDLV